MAKQNKLKTLKDLMVYGSGFTFSGKRSKKFPYSMFRKIDLRQEAIKQHKAIDDKKCRWTRKDVLNWIEYFFNITEEELK